MLPSLCAGLTLIKNLNFTTTVDIDAKTLQDYIKYQDTGFARTNLPPRARWLAKADAAFRQPSGIEPSLLEGFFMGGFVPDCHTQTFVEVAKLEQL